VVDGLKELARTLVHNHIQLCVPAPLRDGARKVLLADREDINAQPRAVVAVVGAGFSSDAVGLPLANEAIKILLAELGVPELYLAHELRRLSMQYRLEPEEFETVLLALSRFEPSPLRKALARIFDRRFYTAHSCEVLAHLLKHRFIDAIISFNFDEVLDQAVEDELGPDNYWRIVSDGDLPSDTGRLWDDDDRLRFPLLIKPHGTASHRSSMRFTREDYSLLPEGMDNLLLECLQRSSVTILTLGFGMQSVEFTAILREATGQHSDIKVIAVDRDPHVLERLPPEIRDPSHVCPNNGFSCFLASLWAEATQLFSASGRYRGTQRHELLAKLFLDRPEVDKSEEQRGGALKNYLRDRTLVEIALATAKAKGFVNIEQLQSSRAGRYLRYYLEHFPLQSETLYTLCECLGLRQVGYSRDTLRLPTERDSADQLIISDDEWSRASAALGDALCGQLSNARCQIMTSEAGLVTNVLNAMYQGEEVEVCSPRRALQDVLFEQPVELRSLTAANVYTVALLKKDWDLLLCVAETAEWLHHDAFVEVIRAQGRRRICMIVADRAHESQLKTTYETIGIGISIVALPWWLHNQHMTIMISKRKPIGGLYFERRQRSMIINPLGLTTAGDLGAVLDVFVAYWIKAERYAKHKRSLFVHNEDLDEARRKLL